MSESTIPAPRVPLWKRRKFWAIAVPVFIVLAIIGSCIDDGGDEAGTVAEMTVPPVEVTTEAAPETTDPEAEPTETKDPDALDDTMAYSACQMYGDQQYPYGFDIHTVLGKLAEEQREDGSWFFKYKVTITNAYNAEYDANMECYVSGTANAPVVDEFLVY